MSDDWKTPHWLWGKFDHYYDPCPPNGVGLREFDGLSGVQAWLKEMVALKAAGLKLNPPHSDPLPWVVRGIGVSQTPVHGYRFPVVMLLRLDSTTQHHKALTEAGFHPFGAFERIAYGNAENGGRYANVLWFSPDPTPEAVGKEGL